MKENHINSARTVHLDLELVFESELLWVPSICNYFITKNQIFTYMPEYSNPIQIYYLSNYKTTLYTEQAIMRIHSAKICSPSISLENMFF